MGGMLYFNPGNPAFFGLTRIGESTRSMCLPCTILGSGPAHAKRRENMVYSGRKITPLHPPLNLRGEYLPAGRQGGVLGVE